MRRACTCLRPLPLPLKTWSGNWRCGLALVKLLDLVARVAKLAALAGNDPVPCGLRPLQSILEVPALSAQRPADSVPGLLCLGKKAAVLSGEAGEARDIGAQCSPLVLLLPALRRCEPSPRARCQALRLARLPGHLRGLAQQPVDVPELLGMAAEGFPQTMPGLGDLVLESRGPQLQLLPLPLQAVPPREGAGGCEEGWQEEAHCITCCVGVGGGRNP
mmetsp:Transcript_4360/g.10047  ORF Transcript_4360/g.10047 Transcript_4360/m.10047 type:complete len:218 (+) Transcript_4360:687-1340(+)